jgi:hypothetical protein
MGSPMAEPTLDYRIWQYGTKWLWQVMDARKHVLASGAADSSRAARRAAFAFCLDLQRNQPES